MKIQAHQRLKAARLTQKDLEGFAAEACTALQVLSNRFDILDATEDSITVAMRGTHIDHKDFKDFADDLRQIRGLVTIQPNGQWIIRED